MTKQEIIDIVKEIGISKGYRSDYPEDWYKGISFSDTYKITDGIQKNFKTLNNTIRACFPNYEFLEWKFKRVTKGFWEKDDNKIIYLKWLSKKLKWEKPEDWYNITQKILRENFGHTLSRNNRLFKLLNILYPNYEFDFKYLNSAPNGYWNDFDVLKEFLLPKCQALGRMLIHCELLEFKGLIGAINKHGGVLKVAEKLGFKTVSNFRTLSGNIVKSSYEVIVDNFLFLNNIKFEYENKIVEDKKYLFDFKINYCFIEVWGFKVKGFKDREYDESRKEKEILYASNKFKLISIEAEFFNQNIVKINNKLKNILIENNIKTNDFYDEDLNKLMNFESYTKDVVFLEMRNECVKLEIKTLPTKNWWIKHGFKNHILFFKSHKIKIPEILINLNLNNSTNKSNNYWKEWTKIEKILLPICKKIGKFPTASYLKNNNNQSLLSGINAHHGGLNKVALKLGYDINKKENGYWENWDNLKNELLIIYDKIGKFPSTVFLKSINNDNILASIYKYHGGTKKVKEIFEKNNYYKNEI